MRLLHPTRSLLVGISFLVATWGGGLDAQEQPPRLIGRAEGLPSSQVHDIAIGPQGFPWFAGPNGLIRYTGRRLLAFGPEDGLSTQGLRALASDDDGSLWIGHDQGVDRWTESGGFEQWSAGLGWEYGFVESILIDGDGVRWFGTADGLVRAVRDGDRWTLAREGAFAGQLVADMAAAPDGTLWVVGPALGLWRRTEDGWTRPRSEAWRANAPLSTVGISPSGTVIIGGDGLSELAAPSGELLATIEPGWSERAVGALMFRGEAMWASIGGKLAVFERVDAGWRTARVLGLSDTVNGLAVDDNDDVWVATEGSGVAKFTALGSAASKVPAPCETAVFSISEGESDELLLGGGSCSWSLRRESLEVMSLNGLAGVRTWDLRRSADGDLWAATDQGLLHQPAGGGPTFSRTPLVEPGRVILERGNELLVGTINGLFARVGAGFEEVRSANGGRLGYVYTMEVDPEGRLWVGTIGNGLWHEGPDGELKRAPVEGLDNSTNVYSLAFGLGGETALSHARSVWVLGADGRRTAELELGAIAWALEYDAGGRLWIGGSDGLSAYEAEGSRTIRRITVGLGIPAQEFTTSRSLFIDEDELWIGGSDRASVIDGSIIGRLPALPAPVAVAIESKDLRWSEDGMTASIVEGPWVLDLYPAVSWFIDETHVIFSYRVPGFLDEWQELPADSPSIRFTSLPVGHFAVEVRATSPLVGDSPTATLLILEVERTWWRVPVMMLVALFLVAIGVLIQKVRSRAVKRRSEELELLVSERTEQLAKSIDEMERMALEDNLTGLANRRRFLKEMQRLSARAQRTGEDFCLVLTDLDGFKEINDRWGHTGGDEVLAEVAARLREAARETDLVCRYGGDEFATLGWDKGGRCDLLAERMRRAISEKSYTILDGVEVRLAASFGVCTWMDASCDTEALFRLADRALYESKEQGRRVVAWTPQLLDFSPSSEEE